MSAEEIAPATWLRLCAEQGAVSLLGLAARWGVFGEVRTWEKAPDLLCVTRGVGKFEVWSRWESPALAKPELMNTMYVRRS